jgi:hypothetical protein
MTTASATVTEPVGGANPNFTATPGDASKYSAEVFTWGHTASGTWLLPANTFIGGQTYRANVLLTPTAGNAFDTGGGTTVTINGTPATYVQDFGGGKIYRYDFTATVPPLIFTHNAAFDIPAGNIRERLPTTPPINVSSGASGGLAPYTVSKVSGASWLNVSASGEISGTRPATERTAGTMTIRVDDSNGGFDHITLQVGAVNFIALPPGNPISDFDITLTMPTAGSPLPTATAITLPTGADYYVDKVEFYNQGDNYYTPGLALTTPLANNNSYLLLVQLTANPTSTLQAPYSATINGINVMTDAYLLGGASIVDILPRPLFEWRTVYQQC